MLSACLNVKTAPSTGNPLVLYIEIPLGYVEGASPTAFVDILPLIFSKLLLNGLYAFGIITSYNKDIIARFPALSGCMCIVFPNGASCHTMFVLSSI
jgi:hypothetical protein